jgi:heme oxygenase
MSLRDQIKDNHTKAEQHPFIKILMSGYMPAEVYADFLYNQLHVYTILESLAGEAGLLEGVENICRVPRMESDFLEFAQSSKVNPSTVDYISYLHTVPKDKLLGHVYAKHFGDLYGGQILKKVVPGQATMYDFEDRTGLIARMREKLTDDLGDEANKALEFSLKLFDELAHEYDISAA